MEKVTKRKYTESFRTEAVRMVLEQGQTIAEVARTLEISDKSLANWVRKGRRRVPSSVPVAVDRAARPVSELEAEVSRLRAENARLKIEREILKKATAFFAKESP